VQHPGNGTQADAPDADKMNVFYGLQQMLFQFTSCQ
jgi:hypothetical protein